MKKYIYTVSVSKVRRYEVIKKTKTGWSCLFEGTKCFISELLPPDDCTEFFRLDRAYTADNEIDALEIANRFHESLKCKIEDIYNDGILPLQNQIKINEAKSLRSF